MNIKEVVSPNVFYDIEDGPSREALIAAFCNACDVNANLAFRVVTFKCRISIGPRGFYAVAPKVRILHISYPDASKNDSMKFSASGEIVNWKDVGGYRGFSAIYNASTKKGSFTFETQALY